MPTCCNPPCFRILCFYLYFRGPRSASPSLFPRPATAPLLKQLDPAMTLCVFLSVLEIFRAAPTPAFPNPALLSTEASSLLTPHTEEASTQTPQAAGLAPRLARPAGELQLPERWSMSGMLGCGYLTRAREAV